VQPREHASCQPAGAAGLERATAMGRCATPRRLSDLERRNVVIGTLFADIGKTFRTTTEK
jgi:hypothetical protein